MLPLKVIAADAPVPAAMSAANRGRTLYVAKGCVTCHSHQLTRNFSGTKHAPELMEPKYSTAYLERYLADPSIKTDWKSAYRMPNLGLKSPEIASLIAFLNRDTRAASK